MDDGCWAQSNMYECVSSAPLSTASCDFQHELPVGSSGGRLLSCGLARRRRSLRGCSQFPQTHDPDGARRGPQHCVSMLWGCCCDCWWRISPEVLNDSISSVFPWHILIFVFLTQQICNQMILMLCFRCHLGQWEWKSHVYSLKHLWNAGSA